MTSGDKQSGGHGDGIATSEAFAVGLRLECATESKLPRPSATRGVLPPLG